jgi:hypothetical protein
MCWVAPNLSAPSAMDVKPWQSLNASAPRFEGPQILFGARKTPQVLAGRAKPQCSPQGFVLEGSDRPAPPRSVGQSHRPAGSWAYDHGVAAHLSCDASIRVTMLSSVSAFDILIRPVRSIRGWPYLRLRELRVCAAKLVFARQSSDCQRTSVRTPLFGAAPPPTPVAWTAQPSGSPQRQGLRMSRESSDSKRSLRIRKRVPCELGSVTRLRALTQWCIYQERHSGFGHRPAVRTQSQAERPALLQLRLKRVLEPGAGEVATRRFSSLP